MTERNGVKVDARNMPNGKTWYFVTTSDKGSPVAFRDHYDMIRALVWCECVKYGRDPTDRAAWAKYARLGQRFMARCFDFDATYEELREEFMLPR